jgi:predicted RND superfamily exporter protein
VVVAFFALAIVIAAAMLFGFTRCIRSTLLVVLSSLIAVVWQLGLLPTLGYALDPYSMLVPFLVFAIGMSHGAQKMNGIMQDIGRGVPKWIAARYTFRRLFLAGLTALLADAVGFAVLLAIDIRVIQELAIAASIGVAVLIVTNLIVLPILLSYTGVSAGAAQRSLRSEKAFAQGGAMKAAACGACSSVSPSAAGPGRPCWCRWCWQGAASRSAGSCRSATSIPAHPSCGPNRATTATSSSSTSTSGHRATCSS